MDVRRFRAAAVFQLIANFAAQLFAEFYAPLVEAVDVPDEALDGGAVLVDG